MSKPQEEQQQQCHGIKVGEEQFLGMKTSYLLHQDDHYPPPYKWNVAPSSFSERRHYLYHKMHVIHIQLIESPTKN